MAKRKPLAASLAESGPTYVSSAPSVESALVDLTDEAPVSEDGVVVDLQTGEITSEADENTPGEEAKDTEFYKNLAEDIDEDELNAIGAELVELVEQDAKDHAKWYATIARGFKKLGIYSDEPDTAGELTDATKVFHPLILEAATQFQARAMAELLPPGGPVKVTIIGKQTDEKLAQQLRVEQHMNYQLTVEDRGYYDDKDSMFYRLGFTGSEFDKQWFDPVKGKNRSRWVKCENFLVPVSATSLEDAPRYAEKLSWTRNQFKKLVRAGFYRDLDLPVTTAGGEPDENPITAEVRHLQGEDDVRVVSEKENYAFYEVYVDYEVPGDEDPDGIALPYVITVDADTHKVASIYRNWKEDDEAKEKRVWHTHKKFLPGLGFYGWGLFHCIGGLGETATEIVNLLLDAGAFSSLQGGFKSKDIKMKGDVTLTPGEWQDTEMTAEELQKGFYTPPFREPSPTLNVLLGAVTQMGQRFASTTDTMVGDSAPTGPVGTTVALIEQGSKVYTGIHKRLHKAMGDEFIHLADLNGEHLPESYPYQTEDDEQYVLKTDYDGRVDIIPVSDPNIFSSAQRLATAQALLQMGGQPGSTLDRYEIDRAMLLALRVPNLDRLQPVPADAPMTDPLTEGVLCLSGRPVKAFEQQNHGAHIAVHQMQIAQFEQMAPDAMQSMQAHLQEHLAMAMYLEYSQRMGAPLPSLNWGVGETEQLANEEVPPPVQDQIALRAAQIAQQFLQQLMAQKAQQQAPGGGGEDPQAKAAAAAQDLQHKDAKFQQEMQHKDAAFKADLERKSVQTQADIARDDFIGDTELKIDPELLAQAKEYVLQTGIQVPPKKLAAASQVLGKPFADVIKALSIMMLQGQGAGPSPDAMQTTGQRGYR